MSDFMTRIMGAAKLEAPIYEEVEADESAIGQAAGVVVLASIAAGIGALAAGSLGFFIWTIIGALIGWVIWAVLTWAIGTKLLPEDQTDADIGQTLRTLGFAASPGLLRILGFIPVLGWIIVIIANIWMLVAMVVAVRQALDYKSTGRAIGVCIIGFIVDNDHPRRHRQSVRAGHGGCCITTGQNARRLQPAPGVTNTYASADATISAQCLG